MQSIFRLPWCNDQIGEKKADKPGLNKMRSSPFVEIPVLNKLKRKRTDSPDAQQQEEGNLDEGNLEAKKRRIAEAKPQAKSPAKKAGAEACIRKEQTEVVETGSTSTVSVSGGMMPSAQRSQTYHFLPSDTMLEGSGEISTEEPKAEANQIAGTNDRTVQEVVEKKPEEREGNKMSDSAKMSKLQQVIEEQFNLDIQMKHRELQLIEQELAKCQVALEQLRRCRLIPYPGVEGLSQDLSAGVGPALKPGDGYTQPQAPTPWGVVDGPYTRHYAKWLLPGSTFDPITYQLAIAQAEASARAAGRQTRNSGVGIPPPATKSRGSRGSTGNDISTLTPLGGAVPRASRGPLVLPNKDGVQVKLVCKVDGRSNFNSVQGFLNHCRIAHKLNYLTHEEAATDCGQPMTEEDWKLVNSAPPPPTAAPVRTPAPRASVPIPAPEARVHPFNSSTFEQRPGLPSPWRIHNKSRQQTQSALPSKPSSTTASTSAPNSFHSTPLIPSPSTPYLTAAFAKRGLGGDLARAIATAKERIDLSELADDDAMDSSTPASATTSTHRPSVFKNTTPNLNPQTLARSPANPERPVSRKGHRAPAPASTSTVPSTSTAQSTSMSTSRPRPAPLAAKLAQDLRDEIPESPQESPHTADSNPGLVSDHDDDPASDADEDDEGGSEDASHAHAHGRMPGMRGGLSAAAARTCGEMDLDLEVEDEDGGDGHGVLIRPRGLLVGEARDERPGTRAK
ncbi:hypothetical protein M8818_002146 [Zalaria obscura]|uniref:Uncharacterized protein n=1 Tax=Zalaria obscura TaxID=2024903 RepID=A0ACC3SMG9_9PEZI